MVAIVRNEDGNPKNNFWEKKRTISLFSNFVGYVESYLEERKLLNRYNEIFDGIATVLAESIPEDQLYNDRFFDRLMEETTERYVACWQNFDLN